MSQETSQDKDSDVQYNRRAEDGRWWDKHFSAGSMLNLAALIFLAGGFYTWTQGTLQDHGARIKAIETLQISMAEVILRQTQFSEQLNRVEDRMKERYVLLAAQVERLENRIDARKSDGN